MIETISAVLIIVLMVIGVITLIKLLGKGARALLGKIKDFKNKKRKEK